MHIVVHVSDQSSYVEFLVVENTQGAIMSKVEKKKKPQRFILFQIWLWKGYNSNGVSVLYQGIKNRLFERSSQGISFL